MTRSPIELFWTAKNYIPMCQNAKKLHFDTWEYNLLQNTNTNTAFDKGPEDPTCGVF